MSNVSFIFIFVTPNLYLKSFDGENIEGMVNTVHMHFMSPGMGNYQGRPLVVGGHGIGDDKTELLSIEMLEWEQMEDFPFADK